MKIYINGNEHMVEAANLQDLVESRNLKLERVVVEHNLEIVPRERWEDTLISEGDKIELISFVGGG